MTEIDSSDAPEHLCFASSMLSFGERAVFFQIAKYVYSGEGEIVDAGSFIGGSAYCFGRGLQDNTRVVEKSARIHCYDRFAADAKNYVDYLQHNIFDRHFARGRLDEVMYEVPKGYDFTDLFLYQTAPVSDCIVLNKGSILDYEWGDRPIEILFIDVAKSKRVNDHVVSQFFPRLLTGKTILIQQDFHSIALAHIQLIMERLAEHFEILQSKVGASRIYRLRSPLSTAQVEQALSEYYRLEVAQQSYARLLAESPAPERGRLHAAYAKYLLDRGRTDLCARELEALYAACDHRDHTASWDVFVRRRILPHLPAAYRDLSKDPA